ncbi:MAG: hypothetical protein G01um101420_414 [Parcubacteria group bacterium Gr01-1014_20]|nr:MAG: hypothetical protein G01um101420_414 [Parcubacteria group bacterium Gr01-1014_20]
MQKIDGTKVNALLVTAVGANLDATLEPAAFLSYVRIHPWLINVLAAARNHGEIKTAMLEANGFPDPKEFSTKKKDRFSAFLDLSYELQALSRWLVAAGRIFGIRVLGFSTSQLEDKSKTSSKPARRKKGIPQKSSKVVFREGSKRQKINERLEAKKGVGLIAYITERYQSGLSPNAIDREITKLTRVKWEPGNSRDIINSHKISR